VTASAINWTDTFGNPAPLATLAATGPTISPEGLSSLGEKEGDRFPVQAARSPQSFDHVQSGAPPTRTSTRMIAGGFRAAAHLFPGSSKPDPGRPRNCLRNRLLIGQSIGTSTRASKSIDVAPPRDTCCGGISQTGISLLAARCFSSSSTHQRGGMTMPLTQCRECGGASVD